MSNADLKALETRCLRRVREQAARIVRQTLEERCGAVYAIARDCVPEKDAELVRIFANNLTELDTTDYDAREAMEEDDGIHLSRGIRYALTMYLFHIADGWVTSNSSDEPARGGPARA